MAYTPEPHVKLRLKDLTGGRFVPGDETTSNAVETAQGLKVHRVNVWGTIVRKYVNTEGSFGVLELDDFTAVLPVTFFEEKVALMDQVPEGQTVQVLGRLRQTKDGALAVNAEVLTPIHPEQELVKRLEAIKVPALLRRLQTASAPQ